MKRYFLITFLLSCLASPGQSDSSLISFIKSMERNIVLPGSLAIDSCYYSNTMLRISINHRCNVSSVQLSDNAEDWLVNELLRVFKDKKLNIAKIEEYAKEKKIKNVNLFMPIVIRSEWGNCRSRTIYWLRSTYYQFNGKLLNGNCLFLEPYNGYFLNPFIRTKNETTSNFSFSYNLPFRIGTI